MADRPLIDQLDQAIDRLLAGEKGTGSADPELSALAEVAGRLRDLPDDRFKTRLGRELITEFDRGGSMSTSTRTTTEAAGPEYAAIHSIMPFICVADGARLIEFMKHTFGAEETSRHEHHGPGGFVAGVRIGDSDLLVMGDESLRGQETLAALHVYVKDCDAVYNRSLEAGAVTFGQDFGKPGDRPYGERSAFVTDPFGNYWFIATRLQGHYVGEGLKHVTPSLLPVNPPPVIDFLKRAFGAKIDGVVEQGGRLMHAFAHIGEATLELGQAEEKTPSYGFYMHTDNVDAVYERALGAGGVSVLPPADQPFGDRLAIVTDPAGNRWFAAKRL
jgi:uncharacterized glyoxalase superfamily protein PhnB